MKTRDNGRFASSLRLATLLFNSSSVRQGNAVSFLMVLAGWLLVGSVDGATNRLLATQHPNSNSGSANWITESCRRSPGQCRRVAFGQGNYVAVTGTWILTSPDGATWSWHAPGTVSSLHAVAFGNGLFVVVGNEGTILTSPDGFHWTMRDSDTDDRLRGVAWGNGRFVAVGYGGTVVMSKDGFRWEKQYCETEERLRDVVYGRGVFVAVGGRGVIVTSHLGHFWRLRKSGSPSDLVKVNYADGVFGAEASDQTLFSSPNGRRWVRQDRKP